MQFASFGWLVNFVFIKLQNASLFIHTADLFSYLDVFVGLIKKCDHFVIRCSLP